MKNMIRIGNKIHTQKFWNPKINILHNQYSEYFAHDFFFRKIKKLHSTTESTSGFYESLISSQCAEWKQTKKKHISIVDVWSISTQFRLCASDDVVNYFHFLLALQHRTDYGNFSKCWFYLFFPFSWNWTWEFIVWGSALKILRFGVLFVC